MSFLPITKEEMTARGWEAADFVYVTGDAYVDHPTFGPAIITRLLESQGYRVAAGINGDFFNTSITPPPAACAARISTPPAAGQGCAPTAPPLSIAG